jgi:hypothetical protein
LDMMSGTAAVHKWCMSGSKANRQLVKF